MSKNQKLTASTPTSPALAAGRLHAFAQTHLAQVPAPGLEENSTGAILACAFLLGAAEALEEADDHDMQALVMAQLHVTDRGAVHLLDTTRRLIRKYPFINDVFAQGRQAAGGWQTANSGAEGVTLAEVLAQNHSLTLMELDVRPAAADAERTLSETSARQRSRADRRRLTLFVLLLLVVLAAANYFLLRAA